MFYKPRITEHDAKQHLHDIRSQRQKKLALIIDECHQIRIKHKHIFDSQFNLSSTKQPILIKEKLFNPSIELEKDLSIVNELTEYSFESSCTFLDNQISNNRILSPRKRTGQRCLSVSSVASIDKRTNKVYEKWPDYTEISQIVGYKIEKIPTSSPPVVEINKKKGKRSTRFANATKQIKNVSTIKQDTLKNQPVDEPPVIQKPPVLISSVNEIKSKLPSILCPSSKIYSKRIQTRQWLIKNYFSSQTIPLI